MYSDILVGVCKECCEHFFHMFLCTFSLVHQNMGLHHKDLSPLPHNPFFFPTLINSLPNDKIFDLSKFKALADDKINVIQTLKFGLGKVESIVSIVKKTLKNVFLMVVKFGIMW